MTKKEYIRRAMQLRPTAKEWRMLVERAVDYFKDYDLVGYRNAEDGYADICLLVGAIHEYYAQWNINGSAYAATRRKCRRMADKFHCIM